MSLEEALRELREYCRGMPPVAAMQVEVEGMRGDALRLTAPLSANVNDKGNAFGGSLTSLMTVAGWGLVTLKLRLAGQPLPTFRYRDYGSLVSLSRFSAVGNLMGNLMGSVQLEGWLARMFYISLYRMHQMALYGVVRTGLMMLGDRIGRSTEPRLKLH